VLNPTRLIFVYLIRFVELARIMHQELFLFRNFILYRITQGPVIWNLDYLDDVLLTTRNIHFYDENANDESEIVIVDRFLWWIFLFRHRSVVTILQPSLSMTQSGMITKNIIEEHRVSSQISHVTHLWPSPLNLRRTGLHHWTNYTSVTNNIRSITNGFIIDLHTVLSPSNVYLWNLQLLIHNACNSS